MDAVLDGGVLGGQAEGVEADGEQDVVALHAPVARPASLGDIGIPVAGVQIAGRVGQHGQRVPLGTIRILHRLVQLLLFPDLLPFRLDLGWDVFVRHS